MAWTYSGNPKNSPTDTVRFLVGDTQEAEPLCTDEEIQWALSMYSNVYAAAVLVAESISTYLATKAETTDIGPIKIQYGNRAKVYAAKVETLKRNAVSRQTLSPYAGGISQSDKDINLADEDREQPSFSIGMDDEQLDLGVTE